MAQVKEVKGPGPRGMGGPKPKVENPGKLIKRIMDEVFKHYLPAHREEEITEKVFEAHANEIFEEAENRLHAQKAVMVKVMGPQE